MRYSITIDTGAGVAVAQSGSDYVGIAHARRAAIAEGRDFLVRQLNERRPIFPDMFVALTGEADELVSILSLRMLLFDDAISDRHRGIYDAIFCPCLRLNSDLVVTDANSAYLRETFTDRGMITGMNMFEAFPDNPNDPNATGTENLSASLTRVLLSNEAHRMPRQRYDVRTRSGYWLLRHWLPINVPVLDHNGDITEVVHHIEKA